MISMMNGGNEHTPVEFYAAARPSSIYKKPAEKHKRTYTEQGRVLVDGQPTSPIHSADDLWSNLLVRGLTNKIANDLGSEKQENGAWAKLKRLSSKVRLTRQKSSDDFSLQIDAERLAQIEQQIQREDVAENRGYVTVIEIDDNNDRIAVTEEVEGELEDDIKSAISEDSGKGSISDEPPLPMQQRSSRHKGGRIVERF